MFLLHSESLGQAGRGHFPSPLWGTAVSGARIWVQITQLNWVTEGGSALFSTIINELGSVTWR